jgi:DNA processing protein
VLNCTEPGYPQSLLQIYDPPAVLYVRRDASILNAPSLSIVGARRPTIYAGQMAELMGRELAKRGLVIVSGLARGVDALSHTGATSVGGRAIGVHPAPENFPVRNRVIAGMPLGVVIVEGKQYSGSLITARLAMEFGREVFGVPGNVTQEMSFAPNQLIKQGAKLVTSAEDVIEELPTPIRAALVQAEALESEQRNLLAADGLTPTEKRIYELLSAEAPRHIDDLVETTGLNSSEVLATLFDLEMKGIIR